MLGSEAMSTLTAELCCLFNKLFTTGTLHLHMLITSVVWGEM